MEKENNLRSQAQQNCNRAQNESNPVDGTNARTEQDDPDADLSRSRLYSILFSATCDKSFHVASTALKLVERFVNADAASWRRRGLHGVVSHVQRQILARRIPRDVAETAGLPAASVQVTNIRLLTCLLTASSVASGSAGAASSITSGSTYTSASLCSKEKEELKKLTVDLFPIVKETMEKCQVNHRVTYAIVYECVVFIGAALKNSGERSDADVAINGVEAAAAASGAVSFDPTLESAMKEAALGCVTKFLDSTSANVQFMGLKV